MNTTARTAAVPVAEEILNSWKEIANYLDRGVRTVQRWEAELGLPVRRPRGKSRSAVMAMRSDIDQWLRACPVSALGEAGKTETVETTNPMPPEFSEIRSTKELVARTHELRESLAQARLEFDGALGRLVKNLERMSDDNPTLVFHAATPARTVVFAHGTQAKP